MSILIVVEETFPQVITLTLNRPDKRNALNTPLLEELLRTLKSIALDNYRLLILKGNGSIFCSGLDLKESLSSEGIAHSAHLYSEVLSHLFHFPLITCAKVQGAAIAGGAGLAIACDFVIAEKLSYFSFPEVRRGIVPAQVMVLLAHLVRPCDLNRLVLEAEPISAEVLLKIGLIRALFPQESLEAETMAFIKTLLKGAPEALNKSKQWMKALTQENFTQELATAVQLHLDVRHSEEALEGARAFLEKREPSW